MPDLRRVFSNEILFFAAASLGLCWFALSSWLLGSRYIYDRAVLLRARDVERLEAGSLQVRDLSPRRLRRIAVGPFSPASTIAACALVRGEESALLRRAAGGRKSSRLRALTIIVRAGSPRALGLLRAAVGDEDTSIVAGAVRLTSELTTRDADNLLLDVLLEGSHPRSRTATELEPRSARMRSELLALAEHPEAALRFWAVTLLGREPSGASIASAVTLRASDIDPSVRAAAAEALGKVDSEVSKPTLGRLLEDNVFYVRAHAARGIGEAKIDELTGDVAALLADTNWWVRAAAKESLLALGANGFRAAVVALEHEDRFARDGALEIIVGSVHLQDLLAAAKLGDPEANALAATIARRRAGSAEAHRLTETPGAIGPPAMVAA
jgi:hypothetical protein